MMQYQYRQNRDKKTRQIAPKTVWPSLTDRQQEQVPAHNREDLPAAGHSGGQRTGGA
jgi:hypothetical protein